MKWRYLGYDTAGTPKRGVLEAATEDSARDTLRQGGVLVLEMAEDTGKVRAKRVRGPKGKLGDISQFMRHVSVLIASGTPLSEGVQAMEAQTRDEAFQKQYAAAAKSPDSLALARRSAARCSRSARSSSVTSGRIWICRALTSRRPEVSFVRSSSTV